MYVLSEMHELDLISYQISTTDCITFIRLFIINRLSLLVYFFMQIILYIHLQIVAYNIWHIVGLCNY